MPVFPGDGQPEFEQASFIEDQGFNEKKITFYTHTGTHIDVSSHVKQDGMTIDMFDIDKFTGKALIIDLTGITADLIGINDLSGYESGLKSIDFAVLKTGWSRYWGEERYCRDFPVLSTAAAEWLLQFNLKGIGIDALSVDALEDDSLPVHRVLFGKELIIIENLNNLEMIENGVVFILSCLPLKFTGADGSPVRAAAILA